MRTLLGLAFAVIGVLVFSPVGADAQALVGEGAMVYAQNCTRCHNVRSPLERTDREWVTIVAHMRARANLTKTQATQVLAFVQAANGVEPAQRPIAGSDTTGTEVGEEGVDAKPNVLPTKGAPSSDSAHGMVLSTGSANLARLIRAYTLTLQRTVSQ